MFKETNQHLTMKNVNIRDIIKLLETIGIIAGVVLKAWDEYNKSQNYQKKLASPQQPK
jgi:hypothetical protein